MGWQIDCSNPKCGNGDWANNIVDLLEQFCGQDGWFICRHCHERTGYVFKKFQLQEKEETWEPYLRGVVRLGEHGDPYQPFVFLAAYEKPDNSVVDMWFSYYKDLRPRGGRLKMGYGPGGPPVIGVEGVLELIVQARAMGILKQADIAAALRQ